MTRSAALRTRVTADTKRRLEELADAERRSVSSYVARVLEGHLGGTSDAPQAQDDAGDVLGGFVYFIESSGYHKVGRARNVEKRIAAMCLPTKPRIVATCFSEDYGRLEMALHAILSHKRANGEWFDLDEKEVEAVRLLIESRQDSKVVSIKKTA